MKSKFTHQELVEIGEKWLRKPFMNTALYGHSACSLVLTEFHAVLNVAQIPDVIGWNNQKCIVIECKTSIADLKRDFKKKCYLYSNALGTQRWFLVPEEIKEAGVRILHQQSSFVGMLAVNSSKKVYVGLLPSAPMSLYERGGEVQILVSLLRRNGIKGYKSKEIDNDN